MIKNFDQIYKKVLEFVNNADDKMKWAFIEISQGDIFGTPKSEFQKMDFVMTEYVDTESGKVFKVKPSNFDPQFCITYEIKLNVSGDTFDMYEYYGTHREQGRFIRCVMDENGNIECESY